MPTIFTYINADHAECILQQLWLQTKKEMHCDVVFIAGTEKFRIPAHRNVLSAASDYFQAMFSSMMIESNSKEVETPTKRGDILQSLIEYIYTGRVEISEDNCFALLQTADELLLVKVANACENFLINELQPTNCVRFAHLAELHRCQNLLKKAKSYCMENYMSICETDDFLNLNEEQISEMFASDSLAVSSEEDVFNSLIKWIEHDPTERTKFKAKLLKLVRLPLLERTFLIDKVKPVCKSAKCNRIYTEALELKLLPNCSINMRKNSNHIMALTQDFGKREMYILYYCPQRFKWMKCLLPMAVRSDYSAAVLNENLFIIGGQDDRAATLNTVVCLNLRTMTVSDISPMRNRRWGCSAAVLKGFLYAVGGATNPKKDGENLSSMEKWNPKTNAWSEVASMSIARWHFGITAFNGKLYVVGGCSAGCVLRSAEYYDPERNEWKSIRPMNQDRKWPDVVVANGALYAVGGFVNKTVERYDPQTDNWTMIRSLSEALQGFQHCTSFRNKIVACYKDLIEEYNAERNEWVAIKSKNSVDLIYALVSYTGEFLKSKFIEN